MNIASPEDLSLINQLIEKGLIEKAPLIALLESQKQAFDRLEQQLQGMLVLVEPSQRRLSITEQASGRILLERELSWGADRNDWESWGTHDALITALSGSRQTSRAAELAEAYGLIITDQGSFAYDPAGLKHAWLGLTHSRLFCGVAQTPTHAGPLDLTLAQDGSLLALADRGEGSIELLETQTFATRLKLKLRPEGGTTAFSLAFDLKRRQLLVTDQNSSLLSLIDLESGELRQQKLGLGVLGNLVMAPDGEHLYVLTLKPSQELVYVRCDDWSSEKKLLLKGELFRGQGHDPCDLISIEDQHLLVMTYLHSPDPFTPIVSVIDTQEVKTLRRTALKDGGKPCQLLFARPNPLRAYREARVKDMILEAGWVDAATLDALEHGQDNVLPAPQATPSPVALELEEYYPPMPYLMPAQAAVASAALSSAARPAEPPAEPADAESEHWGVLNKALDQPASESQAEPESGPESVPPVQPPAPVELDPMAADMLLEMLTDAFKLQTDIDLSDRPQLFAAEAERLRAALSLSDRAEVALEKVFDGYGLKLLIRRRELLVRLEQRDWMAHAGQAIVPLDCPSCHQKLMGQWECPVCGFELNSPLRLFKRQVASAEPIAGLQTGHVLLPEPNGPRLLQLNARKEVVWMLDADQLSFDYPVDMVRLPDGNLLVADAERNQIYELGTKGKIHWSFKTFASDRHRLKRPVRVRWYRPEQQGPLRYLIVDQGNGRVLEIDSENQIYREFGAAQGLERPSDVQYTPGRSYLICEPDQARVLELSPEGELEQSYGSDYGLVRPVLAQRLWNGHTLIVDAGSFQVLELDALGIVRERIAYFKSGMPTDLRLVEPSGLIRMPNQDLLLYNDRRAIQLLPKHKKLIWSANLSELGTQPVTPAASLGTQAVNFQPPPEPERPAPKVEGERPPTTRPLGVASRSVRSAEGTGRSRMAASKPLSPEERLQALIQKRTPPTSDKESFEHSELYLQAGAELAPLSLYLIDWRHNGVIRINRKGKVSWHYGYEMGQSLGKPGFVQECAHSLIIADTDQHRVLEVSRADKEIQHLLRGTSQLPLANPRSAQRLSNGHTLIADQRNKRLVELDAEGAQVWEFWDEQLIASPYYVEQVENDELLFVDSLLNRVLQIDRSGRPKWYYGAPVKGCPGFASELFAPGYATRLDNGNTLICDTRHHRVLEVTPEGDTVWQYVGHARNGRINPTKAQRLSNGHTLITYFQHSKVIELDAQYRCVWSYTMGKDVFLPPVEGDDDTLVRHEAEKPTPFYNAVEKRMMEEARSKNKLVAELHIELMDNVQMKSVRAQLIMRVVEEHGMVYKSFPPPEDLLADRYGKHLILTCLLDVSLTARELAQKVANIAEVVKVTVRLPKTE